MSQLLTPEHLPTILDFRLAMFAECKTCGALADDWRELTATIYSDMYQKGTGAHFGSFVDGRLVAIAGCMIKGDFPYMTLKARRFGWIMDVYVLPEYRQRGLAKQLTLDTLDWLYAQGISVIKLGASPQAKDFQLYHKLGFTETNEMILRRPAKAS